MIIFEGTGLLGNLYLKMEIPEVSHHCTTGIIFQLNVDSFWCWSLRRWPSSLFQYRQNALAWNLGVLSWWMCGLLHEMHDQFSDNLWGIKWSHSTFSNAHCVLSIPCTIAMHSNVAICLTVNSIDLAHCIVSFSMCKIISRAERKLN